MKEYSLEQLKLLKVESFKKRNKVEESILALIISKIENDGKLHNNTDKEFESKVVLDALQSFYKSLTKTLIDFSDRINNTEESESDKALAFINKTEYEIEFVSSLLPKQMSNDEISNVVISFSEASGLDLNDKKSIGQIMAHMKANYDGQFDSRIVMEVINSLKGK